jgi:hypothetical protein
VWDYTPSSALQQPLPLCRGRAANIQAPLLVKEGQGVVNFVFLVGNFELGITPLQAERVQGEVGPETAASLMSIGMEFAGGRTKVFSGQKRKTYGVCYRHGL